MDVVVPKTLLGVIAQLKNCSGLPTFCWHRNPLLSFHPALLPRSLELWKFQTNFYMEPNYVFFKRQKQCLKQMDFVSSRSQHLALSPSW